MENNRMKRHSSTLKAKTRGGSEVEVDEVAEVDVDNEGEDTETRKETTAGWTSMRPSCIANLGILIFCINLIRNHDFLRPGCF